MLTGNVTANDAYLLCTDGLVGMVEDDDIAATLLQGLGEDGGAAGSEAAARALVEKANELGGYDNVTVVIALVE